MTAWPEELLKAAHMLSPPYTAKELEIMRAARRYLDMELGDAPRPDCQQDRSADAYAARTP